MVYDIFVLFLFTFWSYWLGRIVNFPFQVFCYTWWGWSFWFLSRSRRRPWNRYRRRMFLGGCIWYWCSRRGHLDCGWLCSWSCCWCFIRRLLWDRKCLEYVAYLITELSIYQSGLWHTLLLLKGMNEWNANSNFRISNFKQVASIRGVRLTWFWLLAFALSFWVLPSDYWLLCVSRWSGQSLVLTCLFWDYVPSQFQFYSSGRKTLLVFCLWRSAAFCNQTFLFSGDLRWWNTWLPFWNRVSWRCLWGCF